MGPVLGLVLPSHASNARNRSNCPRSIFDDLGVADRIGEIIHVYAPHVSLALFEVQLIDVVLLALMEVNGFGVDGREGGGEIYFADYLRLAATVSSGIDNDEIVRGNRAQADRIRGVSLLDPVPVSSAAMQEANFRQTFA